MKLEFRQRLLATTLLVGASMTAAPAFAQSAPVGPNPAAPPDYADPTGPNQQQDTSAVTTIPETTTPPAGQTVFTQSAEGEPINRPADIVVTGTRIPQPNLESASPVTVVTAQEVKLQGTTRTEDLINSLPQAFAAQGSNVANGATGTATVNLRGLGSVRTLVLVNGRRLMPGDPQSPTADINFVPSPLIRRVDVLTGGASSVYGADAVAGVVNFVMDTTFRGLRLDAQASGFMHDNNLTGDVIEANDAAGFNPPRGTSFNGGAVDVALAMGAGFDDNRGNVMGYATYRKQEAVLNANRDYSYCNLSALPQSEPPAAGNQPDIDELDRRFNCGGSGTSALGTFFTNVGTLTIAPGRRFVASNATTNPPFNYNPYNYFQRPDERYTLGAFANYEISEAAQPYLEAMFMDDRSNAVIAPSGNFFNTGFINCDNPLLSEQQREAICVEAVYNPNDANVTDGDFESNFGNLVGQTPIYGEDPDGEDGPLQAPLLGFTSPTTFSGGPGLPDYQRAVFYPGRRNVEGGGRDDDLQHTAYRIVAGIRGNLTPGISYDAYYQYGTTIFAQTYNNDFSVTRLGRSLDVVDNPNTEEVDPTCRSVLNGTDTNCVPWDIFDVGGVTPAALNYLQVPGFTRGDTREQIAHADLTILGNEYGMILPWTDRGLGINIGAEYRKESLDFNSDISFQIGDLAGQGAPTLPVSGSFDVRELFTEVEVPIITDTLFHELTVTGGYRYSDYSVGDNSFSTDTYKLAAEFAPVRDLRFRASYNRAVRAPNVVELFSAQRVALFGGSADPCSGEEPVATLAQCQLTGVTAAQYGGVPQNPANQYSSQIGGNPDLMPEEADTYTLGVVLQPAFVPGLAVTVDYFDIRLRDAITVIGFDTILGQCLETGEAFFCDRINRDPQGSLYLTPAGFIEDLNTNIGGLSTKGIDFQASYARSIGALGNLNLSLVGTYLDELITDVGVADVKYDCVGYFGTQCGTPNPEWRHKFRAGITLPNGIGISGQWRYFSAVDVDATSEDTDLATAPTSSQLYPGNLRLQAQSYFDLALTARVAERYSLRLGANNIFDRDPPLGGDQAVTTFANGNTFPQVYDALGRYLFAGVTVDF